jgi:predicted nucleic acid-binding protein
VTVFVDSSVWFAAVFARETRHGVARKILLENKTDLVTTDHVLVETWLLLRNRFNQAAAEAFCQRVMRGWCRIETATHNDLSAAQTIREAFADQRFSLIDRTSFAVMERLGITRAASFDADFLIYRYGANRERAFEVLR